MKRQVENLLAELCDEEKEIRDEARKILGDWVDGDSYEVPTVLCIVQKLVEKYYYALR